MSPATPATAVSDTQLVLHPDLRLDPEQFALVCEANPEAVLELSAAGQLITMTPTGGETGLRNSALLFALQSYARAHGGWKVFDSSTGFRLPVAARLLRRSWVRAQPRCLPAAPHCPDLVVELASLVDQISSRRCARS